MTLKTKALLLILLLGVLNLAFLSGYSLYFSKKIKLAVSADNSPASDLGASLSRAIQQRFALSFEDKEITIAPAELKKWVEPYRRTYTDQQEYRINRTNVVAYLENLAKEINTPPVNARFEAANGKISEFVAAQPGQMLNITETYKNIAAALVQTSSASTGTKEYQPELIMDEVKPEITIDKVNNLGIKTLLSRGESDFSGSPRSRANNIRVASKIVSGNLIKPGDEFSFNQALGAIDDSVGYLQELVIKKGQIIPEYGGGICQVSTTLFRATILAGLPVIERHPHSLPVRYYNPQGFDATIYPGSADLRFRNDTPAYILIQAKIEGSKLYFEIYGTDDGRKVTLEGPRQYDVRSDGSLKTILTRTIIYAGGQEKKEDFKSSYQSPSLFPVVRNPLE